MRVVRDKDTKEMRLMWNVVRPPEDMEIAQPDVEAAMGPNDEIVDIPSLSRDTVLQVARIKAGGPPGKIFVHNNSVEAEPATPPTPVTDTIRKNRQGTNTPPNAPISIDEFQRAEREVGRARMEPPHRP